MVTSLKLQKLLCVRKYRCKRAQNVCNLVDKNHIYIQIIPEGYLSDGLVQRLTKENVFPENIFHNPFLFTF